MLLKSDKDYEKEREKTSKKLIEMLKQNTGVNMLDSGSAYGRHWERNQTVDFEKNPSATYSVWGSGFGAEFEVTIDLYHYLLDRLAYAEELDKEFNEFADKIDPEDDMLWPEIMARYAYLLSSNDNIDVSHSTGEELKKMTDGYEDADIISDNSYNRESNLSQVIQYTMPNAQDIVILQIHNGCDVRGGYTNPVVFYTYDDLYSEPIYVMIGDQPASDDFDDFVHEFRNSYLLRLGEGHEELPDNVQEIIDAINKSDDELSELIKMHPDKAESYKKQQKEGLKRLYEDLDESIRKSGVKELSEEILGSIKNLGFVAVNDHELYYKGELVTVSA